MNPPSKMLRAFIAVEIPADLRARIAQATASLRQSVGARAVRWVAPENIHLTLKFLGDVSPENLTRLEQVIRHEAGNHAPFDLTLRGLGCFPNPRRPRVLWVGLEAPPALEKLQRNLNLSTARLGYTDEDRPFAPHLTLGRVNPQADAHSLATLRAALEDTHTQPAQTAHIAEICLFQSDLRPTGAVYTPLMRAPLGAANP